MTRSIILPLPPSLNNIYVNAPGKGRVKSAKYKAWQTEASLALRSGSKWKVGGRVAIMIDLPTTMKGDISNRIKAIEDILVACDRIDDDRNVIALQVAKQWPRKNSCLVEVLSA